MDLQLEPVEARVLGVLIEKELTTPEQYPLSLNALTNGCNQKNNRQPVTSLSDAEVQQAILRLRVAQLVEFVQLVGQRVEKYRHRAGPTLHLDPPQVAVMAELLLRGPQTAGELRQRAERMHPIESLAALDAALAPLMERGLVVRLPPEAGTRAALFAQTLSPGARAAAPGIRSSGPADTAASAPAPGPATLATPAARPPSSDLASRVAALEGELGGLRERLEQLERRSGAS